MEEDYPKSATEPLSEETSRPSSSSRTGAGQKHEAPQSAGGSVSNIGDSASVSVSAPGPGPGSGGTGQQQSKRRRGLGVVTPNACTECRKKRAKCDGQKPCSRCKSQKDVQCIYEVPVRQSKEGLRHQIEFLRQQKRQSDSVIEALARPELRVEVLNRIQNKQTVQTISEWLDSNVPPSPSLGGAAATGPHMPGFPQQSETRTPVSAIPPLTIFGNVQAPADGYAPATMSPLGPQPLSGLKHDFGAPSPWNFSQGQSQSQSASARSDSHPDIRQWIAEPHSRVGMWIQDQTTSESPASGASGADQVLEPLEDWSDAKLPPTTWTGVTNDVNLVRHLLALYFCWEYPTFASLSKEHFLKDFNSGRHRYCSPVLINALLALGCRFSEQPRTRADPNDPRTSGDHFFKEALRLLSRETNHHNLTTIQALGIMSIREASCGRDSESWYYAGQSIRLSTEMGLHRLAGDGDADELAVQAATFWGAFALDHAWSLATGSLPQCSAFPQLPPKPAIIDDIEASLWIPYTDDGAPLSRSCEQPSNVRSVYKCFCELSELVHKSLYVLHSPVQPVTSRDLLYIYHEYLNWYDRIPEVLRLGHNFTPAVLFAHMYYHFAILLLFRPLVKLRIIGSYVIPRDVCVQAADAIQGLLRSYAQLYTLKRTPSFVPYFVLTSTIMHLASGPSKGGGGSITSPAAQSSTSTVKHDSTTAGSQRGHGGMPPPPPSAPAADEPEMTSPSSTTTAKLHPRAAEALAQGIADLAEMAPCHHFAEQALSILRYLAKKWNVEVDIPRRTNNNTNNNNNNNNSSSAAEAAGGEGGEDHGDEDDDLHIRPATSSLNFFVPKVVETDFICDWGHGGPMTTHKTATPTRRTAPTTAPHHTNQHPPSVDSHMGGMENMETAPSRSPPVPGDYVASAMQPLAAATTTTADTDIDGTESKTFQNPLFWPFPMQGRPMLPEGPRLREAGFEPL